MITIFSKSIEDIPYCSGTYWIKGHNNQDQLVLYDLGYSHNLHLTVQNMSINLAKTSLVDIRIEILKDAVSDPIYFYEGEQL